MALRPLSWFREFAFSFPRFTQGLLAQRFPLRLLLKDTVYRLTDLQTTRDDCDFIFKLGFLSVSVWKEVVFKLQLLVRLPPGFDRSALLGKCFHTCPALITPVWKQITVPTQPS